MTNFNLPSEELGCAHLPWSSPRYSADPQQTIDLYVVPYPQAILKFHCPSSLDYRACQGLPVVYFFGFFAVALFFK